MKIGIISMQRVANYGSYLQAAGLKSILESLGHTVVFIDYKPGWPVVKTSLKKKITGKIKLLPIFAFLNDYIKYNILNKKIFPYEYRLFYLHNLGIKPYRYNYSEEVDIAIIGSDEVFNCLQDGINVGFSPMLFGQNINTRKVITYAASCGYTTVEGIHLHKLELVLSKYLKDFSCISVRDNNTKNVVSYLTGREPVIHLDPVLIADYDVPTIRIPYQNYVILYTYSSRKYDKSEIQEIIDFCKYNGKTLISIGNVQPWIENKVHASPLELLSYFANADFIITDTFHGAIFSIKYNKNFVCRVRPDNQNKLEDLLIRLKQQKRILSNFRDLQRYYESRPEYVETNAVIQAERKRAYDYLKKI